MRQSKLKYTVCVAQALIEFRSGIPRAVCEGASSMIPAVGRCRFCKKSGNTGTLALGNVCAEQECQVLYTSIPQKKLA